MGVPSCVDNSIHHDHRIIFYLLERHIIPILACFNLLQYPDGFKCDMDSNFLLEEDDHIGPGGYHPHVDIYISYDHILPSEKPTCCLFADPLQCVGHFGNLPECLYCVQ